MSKKSINLEIQSTKSFEQMNLEWMEVESPTGNFFVGPEHSPLVSIIKQNSTLKVKHFEGKEESIEISGGFLFVKFNQATILLD